MSSSEVLPAARAGSYVLGSARVARMGYGTMQLRRFENEPARALALLEQAADLGVDHFDTAQFYGNGFVNEMLGQMLAHRDGIVVASKVGADPDLGGKIPLKLAQRPKQLRASVEDNLKSLGVDHIPVVNLRRADVGPGLKAEGNQIVDLDEQLATMIAMRDEGKIGAIGLSAVDLNGLKRAIPAGISCVSNAYSLVDQHSAAILSLCQDNDIAWVPFFPLGGAYPGLPKVSDQQVVIDIAARLAATPAQIGLAWLLARAPNILLIPGTADHDHLECNIAAASITLSPKHLADLNAFEPLAPGEIEI